MSSRQLRADLFVGSRVRAWAGDHWAVSALEAACQGHGTDPVGMPASAVRCWRSAFHVGDGVLEVPVTGARVPRLPAGWRLGRPSRRDYAARSPAHHQAVRTPTRLGPAATGTTWRCAQDDRPGLGADEALGALYHAHYCSLVRIAALLTGGVAAEQIVQDAYVSMHRAWRRLRDEDEALGYLRRELVSRVRSGSAASPGPSGLPRGLAGAGPPATGIPGALLMAALSGLPARQREALVLMCYANWPDSQIAAAMGISRRALGAHVRLGMSALRARVPADRGGDI